MFNRFERIYAIIGSSVTIAAFVITIYTSEDNHKLYGYITAGFLLLILIVSFSFWLGKYFAKRKYINVVAENEEISLSKDAYFVDNIISYFKLKQIANDYEEIIRIGLALSTPLWLSQRYETRIVIGEIIEDAAIKSEKDDVLVKLHIDDLGWTNVELGKYEKAELKILSGINLAKSINSEYYIAKGYRHLFGLNYRQNILDSAEKYLNEAINYTATIQDPNVKNKAEAEIHFAKSSLEHKKGNIKLSLQEINLAKSKYKCLDNKEWSIKIMAREGEILISDNDIEGALLIFKKGLSQAQKYNLKKQIVVNMLGIGKCYYEKKEIENSEIQLRTALDIANEIGMYHEIKMIETELSKISKN